MLLASRFVVLLPALVALLLSVTPPALAASDLPTVDHVALDRYAGRWYEVARLPNRFEKFCIGDVTATYGPLEDGRLSVVNQCRKEDGTIAVASGVAKLAEKNGSTSRLKVRFAPAWLSFLPLVWGDYWVIALADDYSWSLVGAPNRDYLWILSRSPRMDQASIDMLLKRAKELGFDIARVEAVNNH